MRCPGFRRVGGIVVPLQAWRKVAEILDDLPALDPWSGFEHQDGEARGERLLSDRATDDACSGDDDVRAEVSRHSIGPVRSDVAS
jgi:hypothetical protein